MMWKDKTEPPTDRSTNGPLFPIGEMINQWIYIFILLIAHHKNNDDYLKISFI